MKNYQGETRLLELHDENIRKNLTRSVHPPQTPILFCSLTHELPALSVCFFSPLHFPCCTTLSRALSLPFTGSHRLEIVSGYQLDGCWCLSGTGTMLPTTIPPHARETLPRSPAWSRVNLQRHRSQPLREEAHPTLGQWGAVVILRADRGHAGGLLAESCSCSQLTRRHQGVLRQSRRDSGECSSPQGCAACA